jgi:hypothetical protein
MYLTTQVRMVPRVRMSGAIPLIPVYAFVVWTGRNLPLIIFSCYWFYAIISSYHFKFMYSFYRLRHTRMFNGALLCIFISFIANQCADNF